MNIDDLNVTDGFDQRRVYEEFKKYCKLCVEGKNEFGVSFLHVTNGNPNTYFAMDVEFIPKESQLEIVDRIFVHGFGSTGYTLDSLLKIGYEKLGADAFNSKEYVSNLNAQIEQMSKINTSSHAR